MHLGAVQPSASDSYGCICRGFWGSVVKGAKTGARGVARSAKIVINGAQDTACCAGNALGESARQHPYHVAAAGVAIGVGLAAMQRGQGGRGGPHSRHH